MRSQKMLAIGAVTVLLIFSITGCSYLKNRGNDLLDLVDVGITVNKTAKPQFRLYFKPGFFPIGYSKMNGTLIGLGNRHFGIHDFEADEYGLFLTGKERYGTAAFNPEDPRQVWPTYDKNEPGGCERRPIYYTGLMPLVQKDKPKLWTKYIEVPKGLHLGWIGIHLPHRPFEVFDFLFGFATIDFMGDDTAGKLH